MEGCKPFRYADDMVLSFQYLRDAQRVRKVLDRRLEKYGLQLNVDKTRIVPFSKKKHKLGERQGSFKFLGFTFYLGKSIRGAIIPKLKTEGKRFRMKLQGVKSWCRTQRHQIRMVHFWKQYSGLKNLDKKKSNFVSPRGMILQLIYGLRYV